MSSIAIGLTAAEATPAVSSRASVSTDPDAFAAQLQSATAFTSPIVAAIDHSDSSSDAPAGNDPIAASEVATSVVAVPADFPPTDATASVPNVVAPAPAPVVRSDADTPQSAATSTSEGTVPSENAGVSEGAPTSEARSVDPAAPLTPPPATGRRSPRHGALDSLSAPIDATSGIVLPGRVPSGAPVPTSAGAIAPASVQTVPTPSVAISEALATRGAPVRPSADRTDDSRATEDQASTVPAASPIIALPVAQSPSPVAASRAVSSIARSTVRVLATTAADPRALAAALAQSTATTPAVNRPGEATVVVPTPPLNEQLAPPLFALRSTGTGTHVLTVTVSPEAVGPVTVRAHVTGGLMHVELSAPTDQGTDALRSMLSDLKRDLSQGGVTSALTIALPNSDGAAAGNQNAFGAGGGYFAGDDRPQYSRASPAGPVVPNATAPSLSSALATTGLDVFA